ncbi:uncharacterized protein LOC135849885 isoform X2 [Planococcus citri]|uniref:uncharacterized protein LOC135849885 isoform X2 n=1 Tax=Planococcus citri TaxID=170843 RepID=UPI0031F8BCBD
MVVCRVEIESSASVIRLTASKSGQRSGADHRSTMSRRYHRTMSSDSCECDDEEDYTTSSSTTTGAFDGHSHVFQATHSRQAFTPRPNRANVNVTEGYSQPQNKSRGRGLLLQNCNKKAPQTISRNTMPEIAEMGNIKVTLPNNSGRARVVNFLLR